MIIFRILFAIPISILFVAYTPIYMIIELFKLFYGAHTCLFDIVEEWCYVWECIWGGGF